MIRFYTVPFLLLVVPLVAAEPKPNLQAVTGPLRQLTAELEKVTDEKSATVAKAKVEEHWAKHTEAMKTHLAAVAGVPTAQQATLLEASGKELAALSKSLRAEHDRIFREQEAAYKVLKATAAFASIEAGMEVEAIEGAELILKAIQAYRLQPASKGMFPLSLADIAPLLEGGEKRILDPWGRPYTWYVKDGRAFVDTMSPYSEKVIGPELPNKK